MSFRDPTNPAPGRGEGSGGAQPGRDRSRPTPPPDPLTAPRPAGDRAPASGRPAAEPARPGRGSSSRARAVVPPPTGTRSAPERTPAFVEGSPRASGTPPIPDPFAIRSRPARASQRQPHPASDDPNDPAAWSELVEEWAEPDAGEWDELPAAVPERRPAPSRRRIRETGRETGREFVRGRARVRPAIDLSAARMPAFIGRSDLLGDQLSGILIGANLLSLVVMAVRLATQISQLPAALPVHIDAAGLPDGWGTPAVLWRLPLIAGMSFLMNLVVAWFIAPIDRFAARFVLAAALGVQLIVWIALLDFV